MAMTDFNVYELVEHDDYVTLPNGSRFKRVTRRLVKTFATLDEALDYKPNPGEGYLITME